MRDIQREKISQIPLWHLYFSYEALFHAFGGLDFKIETDHYV